MKIAAIAAMGFLASTPALIDLPNFNRPFPGNVVVHDNYGGELTAWNGPCYPWLGVHACGGKIGPDCHIWSIRGKLTPELKRHEICHCNGLNARHDNGVCI